MKKILPIIILIIFILPLTGCSLTKLFVKENYKEQYLNGKINAEIIVKDYGTIKLELDADTAPITVTNFVNLAKEGFYNNLTFHRIIANFMIQGGDPKHNGTGDSSKTITGEFQSNGITNKITHDRGVISMARSSDYNSASSQFFIVHQNSPHLDGEYAAFGHVTEGLEIVDQIVANINPTTEDIEIPYEKQPIIETIKIIDTN